MGLIVGVPALAGVALYRMYPIPSVHASTVKSGVSVNPSTETCNGSDDPSKPPWIGKREFCVKIRGPSIYRGEITESKRIKSIMAP